MTYFQAKSAYEEMIKMNKGWTLLDDGKIATMRDCQETINHNNASSSESNFEQARRDA